MSLGLADLERKFFQEDYAPGLSTGQVIERRNLCSNPSFEANTNNWGPTVTNILKSQSSAQKVFGNTSMKLERNVGDGGLGYAHNPTPYPLVKPGEVLTFSAYVYSTIAATWNTYLSWRNAARAGVGNVGSTAFAIPANTWTRIFITGTVPDDPSIVGVEGYIQSTGSTYVQANGDHAYIDGVLLEKASSVGTYFDGDTADFTNGTYEWEGTPHQSASRLVVPEPVELENLAHNPKLDKYTQIPHWINNGVTSAVQNQVSQGETVLRVTPAMENWGYYRGNLSSGPPFGLSPLSIGETYTFSVDVRSDSPQILCLLDYGTVPSEGPAKAVGSEWTRLHVTKVFSNPTHNIFISVRLPGRTGTPTPFEMRNMMVAKGDAINYFDGDSPDSFWTNSPNVNNSHSRRINTRSRDQNYLEYSYWAARSGLTPKEKFSYADHMLAALRNEYTPVTGDPSVVVARNIVTNPGLEVNSSDWGARWFGSGGGAGTTDLQSADAAHSGTKGARKTWTVVPTNPADSGFNVYVRGIEPGKPYSASMWVRASIAQLMNIWIEWRDASNTPIPGVTRAATNTDPNVWYKLVIENQIAPEGAAFANIIVGPYTASPNWTVGATMDIDDAVMNEGPTLVDFSDTTKVRWGGTPELSSQELTNPLVMSSTDLLVSRYMAGSGLPGNMSISDHMVQYFKNKLGL